MSLHQETIDTLVDTIKLDKDDLRNLTNKATVKITKICGGSKQLKNDIAHIKKDLKNKQKALFAME